MRDLSFAEQAGRGFVINSRKQPFQNYAIIRQVHPIFLILSDLAMASNGSKVCKHCITKTLDVYSKKAEDTYKTLAYIVQIATTPFPIVLGSLLLTISVAIFSR